MTTTVRPEWLAEDGTYLDVIARSVATPYVGERDRLVVDEPPADYWFETEVAAKVATEADRLVAREMNEGLPRDPFRG